MNLVLGIFLLEQEWWHNSALGTTAHIPTSPTNLQPFGCSSPLHPVWLEWGKKSEHPSLGVSPEEAPR